MFDTVPCAWKISEQIGKKSLPLWSLYFREPEEFFFLSFSYSLIALCGV